MNKLEQAARQIIVDWDSGIHLYEAITALREALAEQVTVSGGLCGGCAKKAADGWALYCVECWEKAEQEPVAWAISHSLGLEFGSKYPMQETKEAAEQMARQHMGAVVVTPLYAAPVRTKDLTDDEALDAAYKGFNDYWTEDCKGIEGEAWLASARAVIAADREKNK